MSDDELLHALRNSKGWPTLGNAAADRIEELEAKIARLREATNQCRLALAGYVSVQSAVDKLDALQETDG